MGQCPFVDGDRKVRRRVSQNSWEILNLNWKQSLEPARLCSARSIVIRNAASDSVKSLWLLWNQRTDLHCPTLISGIFVSGIQPSLSNNNERDALAEAGSTPPSNHCLWQKLDVTKMLIKFKVSLVWTWTTFENMVRSRADFPDISKLANTNTDLISFSFPESKTCYNESISCWQHIHSSSAALDLDQLLIPYDSHTGGLKYLLLS